MTRYHSLMYHVVLFNAGNPADAEDLTQVSFRTGAEGKASVLRRAITPSRLQFFGFENFASTVGCPVFCYDLVVLAQTSKIALYFERLGRERNLSRSARFRTLMTEYSTIDF